MRTHSRLSNRWGPDWTLDFCPIRTRLPSGERTSVRWAVSGSRITSAGRREVPSSFICIEFSLYVNSIWSVPSHLLWLFFLDRYKQEDSGCCRPVSETLIPLSAPGSPPSSPWSSASAQHSLCTCSDLWSPPPAGVVPSLCTCSDPSRAPHRRNAHTSSTTSRLLVYFLCTSRRPRRQVLQAEESASVPFWWTKCWGLMSQLSPSLCWSRVKATWNPQSLSHWRTDWFVCF